jgi:release factor glutamine methyltransferase
MIYEPAQDSLLIQMIVKKYSKENSKVLDMGCGSGIQALTAKENGSEVLAVDIDPEAVKHCKNLGLNSRKSNLFSNVKEKFDLIVFNPPYLPEHELEDEESKRITTGGKEGFEILEKFIPEAKKHLNKDGIILLVISSLTQPKEVNRIIKKSNLKFKILKNKKLFMEELFVYKLKEKVL